MLVASMRGAVNGLTAEVMEDHIRNHIVDPDEVASDAAKGASELNRSAANLHKIDESRLHGFNRQMLQQGSTNLWLFIPSAVVLGALHGMEPGHSKTMIAPFIIAARGTVWQAILLGLAATLSHTAVVWAIALGGQYLGRN